MSSVTNSNSNPPSSTAPSARAQNMNASSGSGLWPMRICMKRETLAPPPRLRRTHEARADRGDPGLPARRLSARRAGRARGGHRARQAAACVPGLGERDGEEARGAGARRARALSRRDAHPGGGAGRARGDPAPPAARALSRRDARPARRRRARRGGQAGARPERRARGADRPGARLPDARPARGPDPGPEPRVAGTKGLAAASEKPALERLQDLLAGEVGDPLALAVLLGHPLVVLEAAVRRVQAVVQLEALEEVVIRPRLVRRAEMDVDHATDGPDPAGLALDPDRDALVAAVLVHTADGPLGEASLVGAPAHRARVIQSSRVTRFADLLKQPFSFLFARGSSEERVAAYVIREHELGRSLDGLDQVGRLHLRLLERVAADERGALEHDVVELAAARMVGTDGADQRALAQPFAAQHRIARRGDRDDDVLLGRLLVRLDGLRTDLLAEGPEASLRAAVGDDALDRGDRGPDARHLAPGLPAAADHAEGGRAGPREVLRRDAARPAGAKLAELVRLDHSGELARFCAEQRDDEARV